MVTLLKHEGVVGGSKNQQQKRKKAQEGTCLVAILRIRRQFFEVSGPAFKKKKTTNDNQSKSTACHHISPCFDIQHGNVCIKWILDPWGGGPGHTPRHHINIPVAFLQSSSTGLLPVTVSRF